MVILQVMVAILSFFFFPEKLRHIYRNTFSNWTTDHNAPNVSENKRKHLKRRHSWGIPPNDFVVGDVEMQVLPSFLRHFLVGEEIAIYTISVLSISFF